MAAGERLGLMGTEAGKSKGAIEG